MRFIAASIALFIATTAIADEYRDMARRFRVTPPPGWVRISDADVKKFDDMVADRFKDRNFQFIAGFSRHPKGLVEVPYILVQETNVRLKGSSYEEIEKSLNAVDLAEAKKEIAARISEDLTEFTSDQWVIDKPRKRMVMNVTVPDSRGQLIRGICTAYFGEESLIQLNCYAGEKDLEANRKEFDAFNDSFRFDPGAEFQPAQPRTIWTGVLRNGLIGGACGLVIALISIVVQKFKRGA